MHLKLNPATLYQLNEDQKLALHDAADNMRFSSKSQRQSMSHSSNLNYSPPSSTIEKRSNSHSMKRPTGLRSESPSKSRLANSRSQRPRSSIKPRSTSSKSTTFSKQRKNRS